MALNPKTKSIIRTLVLGAILIFVMVVGSETLGLSKKGFDFNTTNLALTQFMFYICPAIAFLVGIILLFVVEIFIDRGDNLYGDSLCFNSPGENPAIPGNYLKNGFKLFLISLILFSGLGLYGAMSHQTFTGVGILQHQFSAVDNLTYSSLLIPAAENLGAAFLIAGIIFGLRWVARKYNWSKASFYIIAWVSIIFLTAVYGYLNHLLRYSSSEVALTSVIVFWAIGGLLTIASGSFIPFWVLHICNNLFFSLSSLFSNQNILIGTVIVEIALVFLYLFLYVFKREKPGEFESTST